MAPLAAQGLPLRLKLRSRLQESVDGSQCVDLVECPSSRRLFVDKHTLMTSVSSESRAAALQELDLHLSVRATDHVVQLERYALQGERLHVLHEHCARGDLLQVMQQELRLQTAGLPSHDALVTTCTDVGRRRVFTGVLRGVQTLHAASIAHLDLSPENVFLTAAGVAKVGDLGHARRFQPNQPSGRVLQVAKEAYAAPELLLDTEVKDLRKADAWALGVILWTMCTKRALVRRASSDCDPLFRRMAERGTAVALRETGLLGQMSVELTHLLVGLLDVNPKSRLSVEAALQHPWVLQSSCDKTLKLQPRRKSSVGNMLKKKGEELLKKRQSGSKGPRGRTASAEIELESTRVALVARSPAQ
ncbi:hypothetical protein BBJ28_00000215 [Nothophytophthora sp. Chile5]|nr:hypothetical protein BBJ28_00000215 [Nothophytophthora sp. Chile5]